jgi:hypothetical protein
MMDATMRPVKRYTAILGKPDFDGLNEFREKIATVWRPSTEPEGGKIFL